MPQPLSVRTNNPRHRVKQGVGQVPKAKVTRKFLMPDGSIKKEHEMSEVELQKFSQKIMDVLLAPLAYDAVIRDLQREKEITN